MYGCILAKLINFIAFLVTVYFSIKIIPFGKYIISVIAFMPMLLHQAVSVSADCMINNIAMLFISFSTYLIFKEKDISNKELVGLGILSILFAVSKYVYAPFVGIALILIFSKKMTKKQKMIAIPVIIIVSAVFTIIAFVISNTYSNGHREYLDSIGQNSVEQIKWIFHNPKGFLSVVGTTLDNQAFYLLVQMIGWALGELTIKVNLFPIICYLMLLVLTCFIEENKVAFNIKQKIYIIVLSLVSIFLVMLSMYITWDGVGASEITGVQGRYFIPILFFILLCVCKKENYIKIKNIEVKILVMTTLLNIAPLITLYQNLI